MHSQHHIFYMLHTSDAHALVGAFSFFPLGGKRIKSPRRPSLAAWLSIFPAALGHVGAQLSFGRKPLPPTHHRGFRHANSGIYYFITSPIYSC